MGGGFSPYLHLKGCLTVHVVAGLERLTNVNSCVTHRCRLFHKYILFPVKSVYSVKVIHWLLDLISRAYFDLVENVPVFQWCLSCCSSACVGVQRLSAISSLFHMTQSNSWSHITPRDREKTRYYCSFDVCRHLQLWTFDNQIYLTGSHPSLAGGSSYACPSGGWWWCSD